MADNKFLDDIAKFSNSTLSAMGSMQKQVRKWVGEQVEVLIQNMDLVTRKEYEASKTALLERISALEAKSKAPTAAKTVKPKVAPKAKVKTSAE